MPDRTPGRRTAFLTVSRLLAMVTGGYAVYRLALDIAIFTEGPPDLASKWMPLYRHGTAFSWLDRNPAQGFLLSILTLIPSFAGMMLVWFRSRAGFFIAATGWALVTIVPLAHFYAETEEPFNWDWRIIAIVLLPILWLLIAAFKAGAETRIVPGGRSD